jgi:hypothetical protein
MENTGAISAGTGADDSAIGTVTWGNPGNITSSDNTYATAPYTGAGFPNEVSHYLKATNFGFSIPDGAAINGIVVEAEITVNGFFVMTDHEVKIVKGGTIGSTNKAQGNFWPEEEAYESYGSSSDLWGESWTSSDINASNFGVVLSGKNQTSDAYTVSIDHVRITIYYTEAVPNSRFLMIM